MPVNDRERTSLSASSNGRYACPLPAARPDTRVRNRHTQTQTIHKRREVSLFVRCSAEAQPRRGCDTQPPQPSEAGRRTEEMLPALPSVAVHLAGRVRHVVRSFGDVQRPRVPRIARAPEPVVSRQPPRCVKRPPPAPEHRESEFSQQAADSSSSFRARLGRPPKHPAGRFRARRSAYLSRATVSLPQFLMP